MDCDISCMSKEIAIESYDEQWTHSVELPNSMDSDKLTS